MKSVSFSTRTGIVLVCLMMFGGCETTLGRTETNVIAGGALGAAAGALVTVASGGCLPCAALIGGGIGSGSGYVYSRLTRKAGR